MKPTVIVLTGMAGSGKTTAADYFHIIGFPVVRMGDLTDKLLRKANLPPSEKNEKNIREALRKKFGDDIYSKKTIPFVLKLAATNKIIIIDGMRSLKEWDLFVRNLPNPEILFLNTARKIRFDRLKKRKIRPLTLTEAKERDSCEKEYFNLPIMKKHATYVVDNNGRQSDLYRDLRQIAKNL